MDLNSVYPLLYPEGYKEQVKKELCAMEIAAQGLLKAELSGLLAAGAHLTCNDAGALDTLVLQTDVFAVAGRVYRISKTVFDLAPVVRSVETTLPQSGMMYQVLFKGDALIPMLQSLYLMREKDHFIKDEIPAIYAEKQRFFKAFVRGVFLACGTMADPQKTFRIELVGDSESFLTALAKGLERYDIKTHCGQRHKRFVLTAREGESVATFLQLIGANRALFGVEDARVVRDLRNATNRRVNCDVSNINKANDAAKKQMHLIKIIEDYDGLDGLPESLKMIAELRKANPDVSIRELGEMMTPPLSKSGVFKRFEKLEKIADALSQNALSGCEH